MGSGGWGMTWLAYIGSDWSAFENCSDWSTYDGWQSNAKRDKKEFLIVTTPG
jgi:hypothetical protein